MSNRAAVESPLFAPKPMSAVLKAVMSRPQSRLQRYSKPL